LKRSWIVFRETKDGRLLCCEDKHEGQFERICKKYEIVGLPYERSAKDAISYVEDILRT
jgi:hypothetical protein